MAHKVTELKRGKIYHIYNRGINSENLFKTVDNYPYFLKLYVKHIFPIADTYAYCLLKNHFHLVVRIKDLIEIEKFNLEITNEDERIKIIPPHQSFGNMFNAYAKAINIRNNRTGSLFETPFKRKIINNNAYLKNVIKYVHYNPVYHGFCRFPIEYPWSSFESYRSDKPSKLNKNEIIDIFDGIDNFQNFHAYFDDFHELENLIHYDKI